MDRFQLVDIADHVAGIDALRRAAVAEEVLGGGKHAPITEVVRIALAPLQSLDQRCAHARDELRVFGIAFVGAAPAIVARHGDGGGEVPVDPGRLDLQRGGGADAADEVGVAGRTQADVVREDRRADDVGVAVDRIGAPDGGNGGLAAGERPGRSGPHLVGEAQPFGGGREFVAVGAAVAAVEVAAEAVALHVLGGEGIDLRLDELRDLALEAHARNQVGDARILGGLGRDSGGGDWRACLLRGAAGQHEGSGEQR